MKFLDTGARPHCLDCEVEMDDTPEGDFECQLCGDILVALSPEEQADMERVFGRLVINDLAPQFDRLGNMVGLVFDVQAR